MKTTKEIVAENLVYLRKSRGLTQLEIAEKLNYSDKSVSKWEHGETLPDIEVLKKIADLYQVSIDFIVSDSPKEEKIKIFKKSQNKQNKIIISLLGVSFVWILAAVAFVYTRIILGINYWLAFVWSLPVSMVVLFYFNKLWGKRIYMFFIMSVFIWSLLLCFYMQFLPYNIWLVFTIGLPIQVAIILWSQLKA